MMSMIIAIVTAVVQTISTMETPHNHLKMGGTNNASVAYSGRFCHYRANMVTMETPNDGTFLFVVLPISEQEIIKSVHGR